MPANSGSDDRLARYRAKRSAGRTPEPFGSGTAADKAAPAALGRGRFVVQKHAARRLHYDFRLEMGGVLVSWAVPRGPSLDPKDRRMAVLVENHPLEYADFEGRIPEGNYGAGSVIVWDRGSWQEIAEPGASMESGKILFDLHGHKLRGRWTLVRTKRPASARGWNGGGEDEADGHEWLLIKKPDGFADPTGERPPGEGSVLSGLLVEEIAAGSTRIDEVRAALAGAGAPRRAVDPDSLRLMLCESREAPFSGPGWLFELKHDGYRLIASARGRRSHLRYRRGRDATQTYPEIDLALRSLPVESVVLDGEVVVCDATGRPDFGRLQTRAMLSRPRDVARAAVADPAVFMAFDLLALDGMDARELPLALRKRLLRRLLPGTGVLRYVDHIEGRGEDFYAGVMQLGLEGMVGKRADSTYRAGRHASWIKVRSMRTGDFAVIGWSPPSGGARVGFGGLHLAVRGDGGWIYAGKVGGGFSDAELVAIRRALDESPRARYPFAVPGPGHTWVEPRVVVCVRFKEWLDGRLLRQPTFLHQRLDKRPEDCGADQVPRDRRLDHDRDDEAGGEADDPAPVGEPVDGDADRPDPPASDRGAPAVAAETRAITFSNLAKVFWPAERYTKGDLIEYYREVSPWLLPYLADRPLVLTRFPDGIEGKSFYQKDAPEWAPAWVRTESVWSEHSQRDIHYFVADDLDSLLYVANLGTIPLHVWCSRVSDLARPDWCILDLDPKGAPLGDVIEVARTIRAVCDDIELETYVKTSGSTGLHVLVPLARQCTYEQSRTLAGLISRVVEAERPDIATMARVIDARGGKVYLDWLQNRHGQLLVAPFSARPLAGGTVSMPLRWDEVVPGLDPARFTIRTARARLEELGDDPVRPVLDRRPDLLNALARLDRRLREDRRARPAIAPAAAEPPVPDAPPPDAPPPGRVGRGRRRSPPKVR